MQGKKVSESSVTMVEPMKPQDANPAGNVHGGTIMRLIDEAGGIAAHRHARSNAVTASVDRIDFLNPVYVGDILTVRASLNLVGRTSMEIGVRVEAENPITGENVIVMNCIWVLRRAKDHNFGKLLVEDMIKSEKDASCFATVALENH